MKAPTDVVEDVDAAAVVTATTTTVTTAITIIIMTTATTVDVTVDATRHVSTVMLYYQMWAAYLCIAPFDFA